MKHVLRPLVLFVSPMLLASASSVAFAQTFGSEEVAVVTARNTAALLLLDFDRDGDRDVIQTARVGDLFGTWLENLGTNQFAAQRSLGTGSAAVDGDAVALDIDGDGDDDIAFCGGGGVGWVENLGPSHLGAPQMFNTRTALYLQIEAGDINGDGLIDLVTYQDGGIVRWFANLGSGSFSSSQVVGQNLGVIRGIDVADLDLDGDLDVVYAVRASISTGEIRWLEQNGAGAFAGASTLVDGGDRLFDPVVADIDADGIPDLNYRSDSANGPFRDQILSRRGLAGGGLGPDQRLYGIGSGNMGGYSLIDLRGIGRPDLLVSSSSEGVVLLRNIGASFGAPTMLSDAPPTHTADFEADDFDGDGRVDLVVTLSSSVRLIRGGASSFDPPVELTADIDISGFTVDQTLASDLSGDGIADVVVSSDLTFDPVSRVHLGSGTGAIVSPGQSLRVDDRVQRAAIDLDGDGDLDLISSVGQIGFGSSSVSWEENLGGGLFADTRGLFADLTPAPVVFAAGDREGDGDLDLLIRYRGFSSLPDFEMEWVDQVAPGVFAEGPAVTPSDTPGDLQLTDVDGDGVADAIVVRDIIGTESLVWRRGDGTGQFGPEVIVRDASELPLDDAAVGDMNGDGRLDLVVYGDAGIELYLWDTTSASFSGPTLVEGPPPFPSFTRLSLADLTGNGLPDVLASGLTPAARWIANMGGGTFGSPQLLPEDLPGSVILGVGDRDGDLDVDILKLQPTENLAWNVNSSRFGFGECASVAPNSTGEAGAISAMGSPAVADNDVTLVVERLPGSVFGYFLVAPMEGFLLGVGGSQGNLCLSGPIGRFTRGPGDIFQTTAAGAAELDLNLLSIPTPTGTEALAPGDTRYFQAWFRDVNPGSTSNLTNALRIPFE